MTVKELTLSRDFSAVTLSNPDRILSGIYACDLLSRAMVKAKKDDAWLTIMSNVNVIAVATLSDVSCIILTEDVTLDDHVLLLATERNVNVVSTALTTAEAAARINKLIKTYEC